MKDAKSLFSRLPFSLGCSLACLGLSFLVHSERALGAALDFKFTAEVPEESYRKILQPIVNPLRFMFVQPAVPTGITGFELGLAATGAKVPDEALDLASRFLEDGSDFPAYFAVPRAIVQKGIPFGIDLAANVAAVPGTDIILAGGAMQWAFLDGPFPLPSMAFRIGHTQLLGLEVLKAQTTNVEGLLSFGIPPGVSILKPYAGAGISWAAAESKFNVSAPEANLSADLTAQTSWQEVYGILGLQLSLFPFISVAAEMQAAKTQNMFSGKLSVGF